MVFLPAMASLSATISDDGLPNPPGAVTASWSQPCWLVSGLDAARESSDQPGLVSA